METGIVPILPDLNVQVAEGGEGPAVLLLHGGGGPATVASIAEHFQSTHRVFMPTHPGWNDTKRPSWLDNIDELAMVYLRFLTQRGLRDVMVIGSSLGGWLAAQMAVRDLGGLISRLVLINAVGIELAEHPMVDFFQLTPRAIAEHSYHEPDRFFVDPGTLPKDRLEQMRANIETLKAIAGKPYMHDPKLLSRLAQVAIPALVLWGQSDRVATSQYGAVYARAFGNGRFELIPEAGHLPQIERPDAVFPLLDVFAHESV